MISGGVVLVVGAAMAIAGRPRAAERAPVRATFGPRSVGLAVSF
jgi:hypothetical protein